MAKKKIDVEIMKLGPDHIMKWLDQLYDLVVEDSPILKSAQDIGNHYAAGTGSLEERARQLVRWQVTKAGTSGFLSGLGGVITMLVAIPANIASVMYVQIRMIAAVAHLGGHDIRNDQVRTLCYTCMCGKAAGDVVKNTGISLGTKLTEQAIKKVAGKTLKNINKKVGFRLVTKFGEKGIINLGKMVPIAGGVVGGTFDAASTYVIGKIARTTFIGTAAPKFNVVSKPNDSLSVAQAARATDDASLSETRRTQKAYWTAFHRVLDTSSGPIAGNRKPLPRQWSAFPVGRTGFQLAAVTLRKQNQIRTELYISGDNAKAFFDFLEQQKDPIEQELNYPLEWEELPARQDCRIAFYLNSVNPEEESDWLRQHEWLAKRLNDMHGVFARRIRELNADD